MIPISRALCSTLHTTPLLRASLHQSKIDLHLVTHREDAQDEEDFVVRAVASVQGGARYVQMRDTTKNLQACLKTAYRLKALLHGRARLIVNNYVEVAHAVKAGVHLGQNDFPVAEARKLLGKKAIIGLTVNNLEQVILANKQPVNYIGVQVFPSEQTKPGVENCLGMDFKKVCQISRHPLVLIGGLTHETIPSLLSYLRPGDGIAMVGSLWRGSNPCAEAQSIRTLLDTPLLRKEPPHEFPLRRR
ncbi:MAG: thiamine phosphate synthase [Parachlamydiales bacterium]|jgi:thiamine-phosphate pyrophosphorylase